MMAKNRCNPAVVAGLMGAAAAVAPVPAYALELPGAQMGAGSEILFTLLLGCTAGATIMLAVHALRRMRANREGDASEAREQAPAERKRKRGGRAASDERSAAREQAMETGSFIPIADPKNPGQSGPLPDLLHPRPPAPSWTRSWPRPRPCAATAARSRVGARRTSGPQPCAPCPP
jgi:hypothetical protein